MGNKTRARAKTSTVDESENKPLQAERSCPHKLGPDCPHCESERLSLQRVLGDPRVDLGETQTSTVDESENKPLPQDDAHGIMRSEVIALLDKERGEVTEAFAKLRIDMVKMVQDFMANAKFDDANRGRPRDISDEEWSKIVVDKDKPDTGPVPAGLETCKPGEHDWAYRMPEWSECRLCGDQQLTKYAD